MARASFASGFSAGLAVADVCALCVAATVWLLAGRRRHAAVRSSTERAKRNGREAKAVALTYRLSFQTDARIGAFLQGTSMESIPNESTVPKISSRRALRTFGRAVWHLRSLFGTLLWFFLALCGE